MVNISAIRRKLPSLNRKDAIQRFKAADKNGDCLISKSEHEAYFIDNILDPVAKSLGFTLNNKVQDRDLFRALIQNSRSAGTTSLSLQK